MIYLPGVEPLHCLFYPAVKNNFNYELLHMFSTHGRQYNNEKTFNVKSDVKPNYFLSGHVP